MKLLLKLFILFLPALVWGQSTYKPIKYDTLEFNIYINNISYNNHVYNYKDEGVFLFQKNYGYSSAIKIAYYQEKHVYHLQFKATSNEKYNNNSYQIYIKPKDSPLIQMDIAIGGKLRKDFVYIFDTLEFNCGYNWMVVDTISAKNQNANPCYIHSEDLHPNSYPQFHGATDSVYAKIISEIKQSNTLTELNKDKSIIVKQKRGQCSDTIIYFISYYVAKNKYKQIYFFANGNISRISYHQENYKRKWFYKHCYWTDRDTRTCEFVITRKIETVVFVDTCVSYYPNGKKYKEICQFTDNQNVGYKIVNAWDTNGVQTLKNGNGYYVEYNLYYNNYKPVGEKHYVNYKRNGICKYYFKDAFAFVEYKDGVAYRLAGEFENGNKKRIQEYDSKKLIMKILDYNEDGSLYQQKEENFNVLPPNQDFSYLHWAQY